MLKHRYANTEVKVTHSTLNKRYDDILPDLFREGQGVVVQGELEKGNHILAKEVLAKHDENYTPPEVEKAMEANHRRPASVYKDPASSRRQYAHHRNLQ